MNRVTLDIDILNDYKHDYLQMVFGFPYYYGKNLDALYDCLGDLDETEVHILHVEDLDDFSFKVLGILNEVSEEFDNIHITYDMDDEVLDD